MEPDGTIECDGIIGTYVDDLICCGTDEFRKRENRLRDLIKLKITKEPPLLFAGIYVQQGKDSHVTLDQREYIMGLKRLEKKSKFEDFRSYRHKFVWIASTRPDITATRNIFSQVTTDNFTMDNIKQMNKAIRYLKDSAEEKLRYETMNLDKARIVAFADSSHATNHDQTSQIGYLIFLTDGELWNLIQFKSTKSRRVVRSPLAAEVHALAEAADAAITTQHEQQVLLRRNFRIRLLTDSKSLLVFWKRIRQ